jgi:hypothetical protein
MPTPLTGSCQCGSVRYTLAKKPKVAVVCHCTECQKVSSGPFSISMIVNRADLAIEGELKEFDRPIDSGGMARCFFCPTCSNRIYHDSGASESEVRLKCRPDDARAIKPLAQIWTRSRQPWLGPFSGGLAALAGFSKQPVKGPMAYARVGLAKVGWIARLGLQIAGLFFVAELLLASPAHAHESSEAYYLANEAVMISHGDTKILFDPLFRNAYGQYETVPPEMEADLIAGEPPFDGVDAVLVSHYHGDHFTPAAMLTLLEARPDVHFYGPNQATSTLLALPDAEQSGLADRIFSIDLEYGDPPLQMDVDDLLIEAVRIPHAGWPERADVQNIVFRVTLDDQTTVVHMGDADPDDAHFEPDADWWKSRNTHLALPPYWFYLSEDGDRILTERIGAAASIGIHVPTNGPDDPAARSPQIQGRDLFTRPGETRVIRPVPD